MQLKNCPFCGEAMQVSPHPVEAWAVCPTAGCVGARQIVVLEDARQTAAWNRRASPTEDVRRMRMREALENIASSEPNGVWAQQEALEALTDGANRVDSVPDNIR